MKWLLAQFQSAAAFAELVSLKIQLVGAESDSSSRWWLCGHAGPFLQAFSTGIIPAVRANPAHDFRERYLVILFPGSDIGVKTACRRC